jgi:LuxR family transcriptional regulator, maltose regulon positive regulatory protein
LSGSTRARELDSSGGLRVAGVDLDALALGTFVERPRLIRRLQESSAPVVLLDAPTGYGKSVLLAQWAAADPRPFASITLTDEHNDPVAFLAAVVEALDPIEPVPAEIPSALAGAALNLDGTVLTRLERALAAREVPMVLVLDELEHVESPPTLRAIMALIDSMASTSRLALGTRSAPALHLGRLRANRRLTELRRTDLVMTRRECEALLSRLGLELTPGNLDTLVRRTEGWPAALYLAGLAFIDQVDTGAAISRFAGDDRIVVDYVRDEFLAPASKQRVDFLKRVSILDRFTGELCDALLERTGSTATLRHLSTENMLLVPLDRRDEWFRFHPLFSEMLRSELHRTNPSAELELHRRASDWWAEHGDSTPAIQHAIAAEAFGRAGELLWAAVPEYTARGRYATVRRWLDRLGTDRIAADPALSLTAAHGYLSRGQGDLAEHWTTISRGLLDGTRDSPATASLFAGLALLDATLARGGIGEMQERSVAAVEGFPEESAWLSLCRLLDGVAALMVGDTTLARDRLSEGARRAAVFGAPIVQTVCLAHVALLAADEDDWQVARMLASQARAQVERSGLGDYPTMAIVFAASAFVQAHEGRVEVASADLRAGIRLLRALDDFGAWYEIETRIVLARAAVKLDDVTIAGELLVEVRRLLGSLPGAALFEEWLEQTERALRTVSATAVRDLTIAELRILQFLPTHLSFPQIATKVYVSPNTVKTQAQAVYRKLGASSRREAVDRARSAGLLSDEPAGLGQP